jgi:hypothetical protein
MTGKAREHKQENREAREQRIIKTMKQGRMKQASGIMNQEEKACITRS